MNIMIARTFKDASVPTFEPRPVI